MIQEALFKYLLVQASPVETGRLAHLNVSLQGLVARRCQNTLRVKALIENQALKKCRAIELDRLSIEAEAAQASIAGEMVDHRPIRIQQLDIEIVQVRIARRPRMAAPNRDYQIEVRAQIAIGGALRGANFAERVTELRPQTPASGIALERLIQPDGPVGEIGPRARWF